MKTKLTKEELEKQAKSVSRRIARDNKAFENMKPAEKRVQIARDVLAQLTLKRLVATSGTWLDGKHGRELFSDKDIKKDSDLQDVLKKTEQCTGCALGGMFMCAVERADKLKISELEEESQETHSVEFEDIVRYMKRFFTEEQLTLIENAFEMGSGGTAYHDEAANWLNMVDEASERMRLIMENIVANKGTFTLNKEPVQVWRTPGYVG